MRNKIVWYLKQCLPLTYDTTYGQNGKHYVVIWKMFLGRCYKIQRYEIAE
jgi:hypothetical protein